MVEKRGVDCLVKQIKLRHERRLEWLASKNNFNSKDEWRKSWENYKVK